MRFMLLAAAWLALAIPSAAGAQTAEQANRRLAEAMVAAWNAHNMKAFGRLLHKDVDWVNVDAGRGRGQVQVEEGHARVHVGKFKDSVMTLQKVEVAPLAENVALVHVYWGLRGDTDNDGTPRPPREGLFTWVTVKEADGWKIRASHNTNRQQVR